MWCYWMGSEQTFPKGSSNHSRSYSILLSAHLFKLRLWYWLKRDKTTSTALTTVLRHSQQWSEDDGPRRTDSIRAVFQNHQPLFSCWACGNGFRYGRKAYEIMVKQIKSKKKRLNPAGGCLSRTASACINTGWKYSFSFFSPNAKHTPASQELKKWDSAGSFQTCGMYGKEGCSTFNEWIFLRLVNTSATLVLLFRKLIQWNIVNRAGLAGRAGMKKHHSAGPHTDTLWDLAPAQ